MKRKLIYKLAETASREENFLERLTIGLENTFGGEALLECLVTGIPVSADIYESKLLEQRLLKDCQCAQVKDIEVEIDGLEFVRINFMKIAHRYFRTEEEAGKAISSKEGKPWCTSQCNYMRTFEERDTRRYLIDTLEQDRNIIVGRI